MGIGNYLLSDEGIGVHVIHELEKLDMPSNVELVDCGTAGMFTYHKIADADIMIAIDAIASDKPHGTIVVYDKDDIMLSRIPMKISPHQIGFQESLLHSQLRGDLPEVVKLVGIVPQSLEPSTDLSPICKSRIPEVIDIVMALIDEYNR